MTARDTHDTPPDDGGAMSGGNAPAEPAATPETAREFRREIDAPGKAEFVVITASLMALTALSIDSMLPALPAIGAAFGVTDPNAPQLVVTFYLLGFALGQVFYGPLSDAFGRKPLLLGGLGVFALGSLATLLAPSFNLLLLGRFVQGFGCGGPRAIAIAVVRDIYGGRRMASIMSFVMMVFIIVPVVAPSVGQGLMLLGHWRWVFGFLLALAGTLMVVTAVRLPETRPREVREPFTASWLWRAVVHTFAERATLGYTIATGFVFGCLMGYVNSAQQIFVDVYDLGAMFPLAFGGIALALAAASWINASFVERFGMRRISHAALAGFLVTASLNLIFALMAKGAPPLALFGGLLALTMFCFGCIMPNFRALSMEPQQAVAGTASSLTGAATTGAAAVLGWYVGQQFDGTVVPLLAGQVILSAACLGVVFLTEHGRLFGVGDKT